MASGQEIEYEICGKTRSRWYPSMADSLDQHEQEEKWKNEIKGYRILMKMEMQRAMYCMNNEEKRNLVKDWKQKYSKVFANELIKLAKNAEIRFKIANWDIDNFDKKRKKD